MQSDMVQNYWLLIITIQIPGEFYFSKHPNIFSFVVPFPGYLPPSPSALSSHAVRSQSVVHGHCDNGLSKTAVRRWVTRCPRFGMVKMWAFEKVVWWPSNYTTQKITLKHLVYIYIFIHILCMYWLLVYQTWNYWSKSIGSKKRLRHFPGFPPEWNSLVQQSPGAPVRVWLLEITWSHPGAYLEPLNLLWNLYNTYRYQKWWALENVSPALNMAILGI